MKVSQVLKESFSLLRKEPVLFIPRFVTTAAYTIVLLYLAAVSAELVKLSGMVGEYAPGEIDTSIIYSFMENIILIMAALSALIFLDLLTYAMYPALVRDFRDEKRPSLAKALREALSSSGTILVLGFSMIAAMLAGSILTGFTKELLGLEGLLFYVPLGIILVVLALALSTLLFFVIPSAVIEKKGVASAFRESLKRSVRHKREVVSINLFFLALVLATYAALTLIETVGGNALASATILLFVLGRAVQAVVYTYISVVNPYFYVSIR